MKLRIWHDLYTRKKKSCLAIDMTKREPPFRLAIISSFSGGNSLPPTQYCEVYMILNEMKTYSNNVCGVQLRKLQNIQFIVIMQCILGCSENKF